MINDIKNLYSECIYRYDQLDLSDDIHCCVVEVYYDIFTCISKYIIHEFVDDASINTVCKIINNDLIFIDSNYPKFNNKRYKRYLIECLNSMLNCLIREEYYEAAGNLTKIINKINK